MSKEEEVFKQQLDAMLSSQSFEMSADNWSGMELLLKQQQKKRRGFFILFTGLGLLLLSSLLWLLMPQAQSNTVVATKAIIKNETSSTAQQQRATNDEIKTIKTKLEKPNVSNAPGVTANKVHSPAALQLQTSPTKAPQVQPASSNALEQPLAIQASNEVPVVEGTTAANDAPVENTSVHETNTNVRTDVVNTPDLGASEVKVPPVLTETAVSIVVTQTVIESKTEETIRTTTSTQIEEATLTKLDEAISPVVLKPDTTAAMVAKPDTDYVAKKQFSYLLEAGLAGLTGWQENDQRDAAGINPLFGAHVSYPVTSELDVAIGLQYTTVGHLKYSKYTATTSHLDLGRIDQSLVFTPTRLHYLLLPMQVSLKLDKKQSIGAGLTVGYLLTADSKVESYTYDYFGSQLISSEKKKGYTEGFRNMDAQISVHYKYRFTSNLQAHLGLMFGLMDVKTGEALPSAGFERNSGAKISLMYTLFRK